MSVKLPLMELFYTIQGEGFHQGKAAVFIRLAGCDVGCIWCDVKESWPTKGYPMLSEDEIIDQVIGFNSRLVVITGGEPLMYDLNSLTEKLRKEGFATHLETSGAYSNSGKWDWFCFSPKKFMEPLPEIPGLADELKIIVYNKSDIKWAEKYQKMVNKDCKLYLQPEWSREKEMMPLIVDYVKNNPEWEISLQIHKYINVP